MKKLITRSLSGVIYIIILVAAIYVGKWGVFALGSFFLFQGAREFFSLVKFEGSKFLGTSILLVFYFFLCLPELLPGNLSPKVFLVLFPIIFFLLLRQNPTKLGQVTSQLTFGGVYLLLPLILLNSVFAALDGLEVPLLLLAILSLIWVNDTFAYIVGSRIGKNKLWAAVSPGKSWEGFVGGIIAAAGTGAILGNHHSFLNIYEGIALGVVVGIFATIGDLFESALKRNAGVKDSGTIMPGHGGILDRIDSLLFVVPCAIAFLTFIDKIKW